MTNPEKAMLGTGWSFPPAFSRIACSVEMVSAETDIRQSLGVLLRTSLGERIMVPNYGTQLYEKVFRAITTTLMTELEEIVRQAILAWEARIAVEEIVIQPEAGQDGLVSITISYVILQTNARNNLVFPFYLNEATIPVEVP
jgi:phage baseplate assembly protein W